MAAVLENAVCTAKWSADGIATACKTAGSCCTGLSLAASGSAVADTKTVCVLQGTLVTAAITLTADQKTAAGAGITSTTVYAATACPAYTAGASSLAVSAAALATAVYMM